MAELTKLESKLAEVLGLAMAAQGAARHVAGLLDDDDQDLRAQLERKHEEARETEERCTEVAGARNGKKTAILEQARETRDEATEMMRTYLGGEDDPLDGFEFLTMAEAGEVGHWAIVEKLNEKAGDADDPLADRVGAADPARTSTRCSRGRSSLRPTRTRRRSSRRAGTGGGRRSAGAQRRSSRQREASTTSRPHVALHHPQRGAPELRVDVRDRVARTRIS